MNHISKIYVKLRTFEKQLKRDFNELASQQSYQVTFDQWLICQYIFEHKQTLLTHISKDLCKEKASVHRIIKGLKSKELVATFQDSHHLRRQPLQLTTQGEEVVRHYNKVVRGLYTKFLKVYFDREFEILINLLDKYKEE